MPEGTPDLRCTLMRVPELHGPTGERLAELPACRVFQDGTQITRFRRTAQHTTDYALTRYDLESPGLSQTYVRQDAWPFAADERYFWSTLALQQLLLPFQCFLLHASVIEISGGAILFSAPSGMGKSTQAELWRRFRGAEVINGDKAAVRLLNGTAWACGVPFAGTSGICKNRNVPLRALVLLQQAQENTVRRLYGMEALPLLMSNIFADLSVPWEHEQLLQIILELVNFVPVLRLACTPDLRSVEALEQAMSLI